MADGTDNLPEDVTLAMIDRHLGGAESRAPTEAEDREDELSDPTRSGLCVDHAREEGKAVPAVSGCDLCELCLAERGADLDAIRENHADVATLMAYTAAETRLRADYLRDVGALVAELAALRRFAKRADHDRVALREQLQRLAPSA